MRPRGCYDCTYGRLEKCNNPEGRKDEGRTCGYWEWVHEGFV